MKTGAKAATWAFVGLVVFGVLLFVPAGTLNYWQAWVFLAVFAVSTWLPSMYLLRTHPAALERRMRHGPASETRMVQKIVHTAAVVLMAALLVFSVLDHRFGWSSVPIAISLLGDALVVIGLGVSMLVVAQNSFAAATIRVEATQTVVSTGLYRWVRHPMYAGTLVLIAGIPLALGSYWGLLFVIPAVFGFAVRILDEEKLLEQELTGYRDYLHQVRCRLVPHVW